VYTTDIRKIINDITSEALMHHLMRPGTGFCMFGFVSDVQSVACCASDTTAAI